MPENKEEKKEEKEKSKSDVLQRLAQASVEGLVMDVALNAILPGAGVVISGANSVKNVKNMAKVMGQSAAKKGLEILDGEEEEQDPIENLTEDVGLKVLERIRGRG